LLLTIADKRDELLDTIYVGKYELLSVIGAGGMGVIYLARQIFLDRLVAIKMLKSNLASAKARMRFHQEGKAASALHHPVIVAINDFGIDELDRPYMVMEHVEGVTLSEVIKERVTLNIAEAMPIFLELARWSGGCSQ
jgi:serine/threonine protein kinase